MTTSSCSCACAAVRPPSPRAGARPEAAETFRRSRRESPRIVSILNAEPGIPTLNVSAARHKPLVKKIYSGSHNAGRGEMGFDTIIAGATLLTGDPAAPVIADGAIGIAGDSIGFVGKRSDLPALAAARVVQAEGRVVTPGFVNVHTHAVLSLMRGVALDMGFAPAYTRGVPHGHDITEDEAVALARLGALEAM